jgi:hypothetical protein
VKNHLGSFASDEVSPAHLARFDDSVFAPRPRPHDDQPGLLPD